MSQFTVVSAMALVGGLALFQLPTDGFASTLEDETLCGAGSGSVCKTITKKECLEYKLVSVSGTAGVTGGGGTFTQVCASEVTTTIYYYWTSADGGGGSTTPAKPGLF